jgi:hypothetical protein
MLHHKFTRNVAIVLGVAAVSSLLAQDRPGIDRAIRVGQFKGTGQGRYWHDNIHTSSTVLNTVLGNPNGANLGGDLVVPKHNPPFSYTAFGVAAGGGNTPSATLTNAFIAALDTLDVVIISCMVEFGNVISTTAQRGALLNFAQTKGYIAVHATTDSYGTWPAGDSIHGTRFLGHPSSDRNGMLRRDSVFQTDSAWNFLNRNLFVNGTDTTFLEEWFFFTTSGANIRANATLKPTVKLEEHTLAGGLGGRTAMGDHPMSWYRTNPLGGRFFYTAVGHRPNLWNTGTNQPRFPRRQLYNAILWVAKYDSLSTADTAVSIKYTQAPGAASDYSKLLISSSALTLTVTSPGSHLVELLTLDGRRLAYQKGQGRDKAYRFTNLRSGVYALSLATAEGRSRRLVTVP